VLTTLHTTSAVSAITRLVDMGMEPFLVGSAITMVVAQRLVRRPCVGCAAPDVPDPALLRLLGVDPERLRGATPVKGRGCPECQDTGYRRRTGVFEVLLVDQTVRRALGTNPTEQGLAAVTGDVVGLREAAILKALAGDTTFDEAARVSPRD
jgi:type IV pilus assembly protein PilB